MQEGPASVDVECYSVDFEGDDIYIARSKTEPVPSPRTPQKIARPAPTNPFSPWRPLHNPLSLAG